MSVPVLSEQMQVTRPMFSTRDRAPHERLPPREAVDADAEEEGEGDRKLLGEGGHGEGDRAQQRVEPPVALARGGRSRG